MTAVSYGTVAESADRLNAALARGNQEITGINLRGLLASIRQMWAKKKNKTKSWRTLEEAHRPQLAEVVEMFNLINEPAKEAKKLRDQMTDIFKEGQQQEYLGRTCKVVRKLSDGGKKLDLEKLKLHLGAKYPEFEVDQPAKMHWEVIPITRT